MRKSERITQKWYDDQGQKCFDFYKESQENEKKQIDRLIQDIPEGNVLDLGCGDGATAAKYFVEKGFTVTGIDLSSKLIEKAKKNVPEATFRVMSMYDLDFAPQSFDVATSFFAILHLEKKSIPDVFTKVYQILKRGGFFLFSVNKGNFEGKSNFFGKEVYFSCFQEEEIQNFLSQACFRIVWKKAFSFPTPEGNIEEQLYYCVSKQ